MDQNHMKRPYNSCMRKNFVLIITDLRGSWLRSRLRQYQDHLIKFKVMYRRGAGLKTLWEIAEWAILTRPVDLIILLGGVCDITSKIHIGERRFYWPLEELDKTFTDISATMKDIARNYRMMAPSSKFDFLPDPGVDLIRLNRIPHPVPWTELIVQQELEEQLELLHLYTRALNSYMGSLMPWSLDVTHAHRNGNLKPVYDRLYDAIHFSGEQVSKLASEINRYTRKTLKLVCLRTLHINIIASYDTKILSIEFQMYHLSEMIIPELGLFESKCLYFLFPLRMVTSSDHHNFSQDRNLDADLQPLRGHP